MKATPPILEELRKSTAEDHRRLESITLGSKIMDGSLATQEYDRLISWQERAHRALEPLISGYSGEGYTYRPRYDPLPGSAESTVDHDTATGIVYVLEGASLGGSIIHRNLQQNPSLTDRAPFAFYRDQAEWGLKQWRSFVAYLNAVDFDANAIARARAGAQQAFSLFEAEWKKVS